VTTDDRPESERLEQLWSGSFGDEYVDRNASFDSREPFWRELLTEYPCNRVLEVGCNLGGNLEWVAKFRSPENVFGIDVNRKALALLRERVPGVNGVWSPARDLPFRDAWFELVFSMGVLIHQPESTLALVMNEMVRCSRRFVLCGEYHADAVVEVPYRGEEGALFKRDYGRLFVDLFPQLRVVQTGFLGRDVGWDDVTWWLFQKQ
jgi:pseudaminic acid biosynthesis-associated methylase